MRCCVDGACTAAPAWGRLWRSTPSIGRALYICTRTSIHPPIQPRAWRGANTMAQPWRGAGARERDGRRSREPTSGVFRPSLPAIGHRCPNYSVGMIEDPYRRTQQLIAAKDGDLSNAQTAQLRNRIRSHSRARYQSHTHRPILTTCCCGRPVLSLAPQLDPHQPPIRAEHTLQSSSSSSFHFCDLRLHAVRCRYPDPNLHQVRNTCIRDRARM